jgi:hypothetical protein
VHQNVIAHFGFGDEVQKRLAGNFAEPDFRNLAALAIDSLEDFSGLTARAAPSRMVI